jgi:hypothetical protein
VQALNTTRTAQLNSQFHYQATSLRGGFFIGTKENKMKIKVLTKFKHGVDTFEQDDLRTVDDVNGAYFVLQAWAKDETGKVGEGFAGDIDLTINNSTIGLEDTHG